MNVNEFVDGLNQRYQTGNSEEVGKWLETSDEQAKQERDLGLLLVVLNEKMNYFKGIGDCEKGVDAFLEACGVIDTLGLGEGVAYATVLINGAGVFWASGDCDKALQLYEQAEKVYEHCGINQTYEHAGLYNDMSILYEQIGKYQEAADCLNMVTIIMSKLENCQEELLVAYGNLGQIQYQLENYAESAKAFAKAVELSESQYGAENETSKILRDNFETVSKLVQ